MGKLFLQVREKEKRFGKVNYFHVPREKGLIKRADKLANLGIDGKTSAERELEKRREEGITKGDEDAMEFYKAGKELCFTWKHDLSLEHVKEIEIRLRKAIELNPELWAPHYYLGELFYSIKQYSNAKVEFEKALKKNPGSESAKYYLTEIGRIESGISYPRDLDEIIKMTNNPVLLNYALVEWFENTVRELIQEVLSSEYGEEWWWNGVPLNIRKECVEKIQETQLKEERKLSELHFIDFHAYAEIIEKKKKIFTTIIGKTEIDELIKRLKKLIPIRNAIMHCRGQYLSEETMSGLKKSCSELQNLFSFK